MAKPYLALYETIIPFFKIIKNEEYVLEEKE